MSWIQRHPMIMLLREVQSITINFVHVYSFCVDGEYDFSYYLFNLAAKQRDFPDLALFSSHKSLQEFMKTLLVELPQSTSGLFTKQFTIVRDPNRASIPRIVRFLFPVSGAFLCRCTHDAAEFGATKYYVDLPTILWWCPIILWW